MRTVESFKRKRKKTLGKRRGKRRRVPLGVVLGKKSKDSVDEMNSDLRRKEKKIKVTIVSKTRYIGWRKEKKNKTLQTATISNSELW